MNVLFMLTWNTWRQFVRDRIFYLTFVVALLLVGFSYLLATLTIAESRKILLDFGFSGLSLSGVCIAAFLGIVAVAREIENKTIYTIVTKPVSRSAYIFGRFLGSTLVLAVTHLLLSAVLWLILRASEEVAPSGFWACCALIFLENLIVLSFAILVSIVFSSVMAAGITFSFFLIGRSSLSFQAMAERGNSADIRALAEFLYYLFPNLERFNIRDVVAYGMPYPASMISNGLLYASAYSAVCLGLAFMIFRKRDLP